MGWDYIQITDPGAVGAWKTWANPETGWVKARNYANNGWTTIGNAYRKFFGHAQTTGGVFTAGLSGVTGYAASDSHDFATSVKRGGVELVDTSQLTTMLSSIDSYITTAVEAVMGRGLSPSEIGNFFRVETGEMDCGYLTGADPVEAEIPLPIFSNGERATEAQCRWNASVTRFEEQPSDDGGGVGIFHSVGFMSKSLTEFVDPTKTRFLTAVCETGNFYRRGAKFNYIIVAVR